MVRSDDTFALLLVITILQTTLFYALLVQKATLLCVHGLREIVEERVEGAVEGDLVQGCKYKHQDHEDERAESADARSGGDCEEPNETELRKIETDEYLLESASVHTALRLLTEVLVKVLVTPVCEEYIRQW